MAPVRRPVLEYSIRNRVILRGGKPVGTLSADGRYEYKDPKGVTRRGSAASLLSRHLREVLLSRGVGGVTGGPTGQLRVGAETLEAVGGVLLLDGQRVGTLDGQGQYQVTVEGTASAGSALTGPGAVWLGDLAGVQVDRATSGALSVGGKSLQVLSGVIYESGCEVGVVDVQGRFRALTLEGAFLTGFMRGSSAPAKGLSPKR